MHVCVYFFFFFFLLLVFFSFFFSFFKFIYLFNFKVNYFNPNFIYTIKHSLKFIPNFPIVAEDSCRYEIHTSRLTWDKAVQACKHRGMTLASFSGTREANSLFSVLETGGFMFSGYEQSLKDR
jgi:hypothetical protein